MKIILFITALVYSGHNLDPNQWPNNRPQQESSQWGSDVTEWDGEAEHEPNNWEPQQKRPEPELEYNYITIDHKSGQGERKEADFNEIEESVYRKLFHKTNYYFS